MKSSPILSGSMPNDVATVDFEFSIPTGSKLPSLFATSATIVVIAFILCCFATPTSIGSDFNIPVNGSPVDISYPLSSKIPII